MSEKSDLQQWDRRHVWHAFTQMAEYEPFIVERAEGCTLYDLDGRGYLDGVSSLWCNVHGHRHPKLTAAAHEQLDRVAHVTSLGMSNPSTIRVARRLAELSPAGLEHVFFSCDGSSAVEVALKMALQYWQQRSDPRPQKTGYVAFGEAYHGDTIGSVSVGGVARFHAMFQPLLFHVHRAPVPDTYRLPSGVTRESAALHYLAAFEQLLAEHHESLAAVILEPLMQCAAGMVRHPEGFLRGVRDLTTKYDVLLIADEVAVGFGRTGTLFACEQEQVAPDFLCLGKGLTGGYAPLSATLTNAEVWQAFLGTYAESKTFYHGHTYGGNPLAASLAIATLDVFEEEQTLQKLPAKVELLADQLSPLREHPHVGDIRQLGMIVGIELVQDREKQEPFPWTEPWGRRICDYALERGVWLRPLGNVVVIMPPLAMNEQELTQVCTAVRAGIIELL